MNFSRVKLNEWLASLCGALILIALFLPWYGDEAAIVSMSVLEVILTVVAIMALILPIVLARSRFTNLPISFETIMSDLATIAAVVLLIKLIFPPEGGAKAGFFLGLIGSVLLTVVGWRSTSREG